MRKQKHFIWPFVCREEVFLNLGEDKAVSKSIEAIPALLGQSGASKSEPVYVLLFATDCSYVECAEVVVS